MKISRHTVNPELVEEGLEAKRELLVDVLDPSDTNSGGLSVVLSTARSYAGYQAASKPDTAELCRALRIGAQASAAIFALASGKGQVELPLANQRVKLAATGPTDATHAGNWRVGWWLAHIVRDRASIDVLASTPMSVLRRSSTRGDECQYLFIEALQKFEDRAPDWSSKLQAALDATDPSKVGLSDEDFVLNILVPEMQMLFRFALGEIVPFGEALEFALERHKKYWSASRRQKDPHGFLALGPLAIASIAFDADMPISVESDYLPVELVEDHCQSA